jgi:hypothetical protein
LNLKVSPSSFSRGNLSIYEMNVMHNITHIGALFDVFVKY